MGQPQSPLVAGKGGRRFPAPGRNGSGNREGVVGLGYGKGRQVPSAIEKAARDARKHLQRVPITDNSIIETALSEKTKGAVICMEDLVNQIYTVGPYF